ncbi:hypothetical protein BABINDRAFT_164891 [Babjeviella inositovora NRRL Y-12698]|uniref:DNA repair metallo-beta-lactamase domain-containing protein n=1 Tax=Babjeviella inositovora NRRL Y-12698 TaxID=984486 RepID=A0A1E3QZY6_9ASCO|nr:uncharacterized protein BABINDRAFT_164891 [Babjeviella inositovora NRRL Y-12698]ODQ83191.1 hypothetical protein BABINDRAFT_164891 [Babjeviella inositovora NRRL Y-12698]
MPSKPRPKVTPQTGSMFDGIVREMPGIRIDRFTDEVPLHFSREMRILHQQTDLYLLSYCHTDRLVGLERKDLTGTPIYCSEVTKKLVALDPNFKHIVHRLKPQPLNVPVWVEIRGSTVKIVLVPSYHCHGSTMFVLEGVTGPLRGVSVLYSGNIRAESWWCQSLAKNSHLFPYTVSSRAKTFDTIYLDTTFGCRAGPFITMPLNHQGLQLLLLMLLAYPLDDPDIEFSFSNWKDLGFEECWCTIISALNTNLHVSSPEMRKRLGVLCRTSRQDLLGYGETLYQSMTLHDSRALQNCDHFPGTTMEPFKARFHICNELGDWCSQPPPAFQVQIKPVTNSSLFELTQCFPLRMADASPHVKLVKTTKRGNRIYEHNGMIYLLKQDTEELLPSDITFFFSRHSSYMECREFVGLFRSREVFPCAESETTWNCGLQMDRIFGDLYINESLAYDDEMCRRYSQAIPHGPVETVDLWNLESLALKLPEEVRAVQYIVDETNSVSLENCTQNTNLDRKNGYHPHQVFQERHHPEVQKFLKHTQSYFRATRPRKFGGREEIGNLADNVIQKENSCNSGAVDIIPHHQLKFFDKLSVTHGVTGGEMLPIVISSLNVELLSENSFQPEITPMNEAASRRRFVQRIANSSLNLHDLIVLRSSTMITEIAKSTGTTSPPFSIKDIRDRTVSSDGKRKLRPAKKPLGEFRMAYVHREVDIQSFISPGEYSHHDRMKLSQGINCLEPSENDSEMEKLRYFGRVAYNGLWKKVKLQCTRQR